MVRPPLVRLESYELWRLKLSGRRVNRSLGILQPSGTLPARGETELDIMQPGRLRVRVSVLAMLLAMAAMADIVADEPFLPKWFPVPSGSSARGPAEPADEADSPKRSSEEMAQELCRLFLLEQPSAELTGRGSIRQLVEEPGHPRVGNLVQPVEEPAEEPAASGGAQAIGTAALIKTDADLTPQKIKAVKYLATLGCECSSQKDKVRDALLAALDDCSEEVRYEAALAFCRAAGNPCTRCNRGSCCGDEVMEKLRKMAEGRDKDGCWYEPSCQVRAAARSALDACRRLRPNWPEVAPGPGPETAPEQDGGPRPLPDDLGMESEAPSLEDLAAATPSSEASSLWATPSPTGTTLGMIGDFLGGAGRTATIAIPMAPGSAHAIGTTSNEMESAFLAANGQHTFFTPGDYNDLTIHEDNSGDGLADTWQLTRVRAAGGSELLNYQNGNSFVLEGGSVAVLNGGALGDPPMHGDVTSAGGTGNLEPVSYDAVALVEVEFPASGIRSMKISENNSSLPRDRLLFNYSFFHNVVAGGGNSLDVNRFVFGFEKTLHQGRSSIETRIPFASTLNSDQRTDGINFTNVEFGNLDVLLKRILCQGKRYTFGAGLAMSFPTASDSRLFRNDLYGTSNFARPNGTVQIMHLSNDAYHLMPWIGLRLDPNQRLFVESFLQFDFGLNENGFYGHYDGPQGPNGSLPKLGNVYDQALMMADVSIGYWLRRDRFKRHKLMGIVPSLELHYATALQDADVVSSLGNGITVNSQLSDFDSLNLTAGTHFVFHRGGNITPAVAIPLLSGDDRQFDCELQLQMNVPY